MRKYKSLSATIALAFLTLPFPSGAADPLTAPLDFSTAPKVPTGNDCEGYADRMPPSVVHEIDAINRQWVAESNELIAEFHRRTGALGLEWEKVTGEASNRMRVSMDKVEKDDLAFKGKFYSNTPAFSNWTEQQRRDFEVEAARYSLESMKILHHSDEEKAQATLNFALKGGDTVYIDRYDQGFKAALDRCKKSGLEIYERWWASERKPVPASSSSAPAHSS